MRAGSGERGDEMTKIEWCDETWNPITGCTPISAGCKNCYAARMAKRLAGRFGYPKDEPFRPGTFHRDKFSQPAKWKKPRRIFVCSMGDLFHEAVAWSAKESAFAVMAAAPWHTYMVLTKRPEEMLKFIDHPQFEAGPFPHVWLGVSVENQAAANERIPILLEIPAAKRFVSCEPLLGPVDLEEYLYPPVVDVEPPDWVIVGSETGPGARQMHNKWAARIRDQCRATETPFFFKKHWDGAHILDGRTWEEFPC
jgi:protein gp37